MADKPGVPSSSAAARIRELEKLLTKIYSAQLQASRIAEYGVSEEIAKVGDLVKKKLEGHRAQKRRK